MNHNQPTPRGGARIGRPPKPPGTTKTEVFTVRCTPAQKIQFLELKTKLNKETTK